MNDYMRENKMEEVKPTAEPPKTSEAGSSSAVSTLDTSSSTKSKSGSKKE